MEQVIIFSGSRGEVTKSVNKWFEENATLQITSRLLSATDTQYHGQIGGGDKVSIAIFYKATPDQPYR